MIELTPHHYAHAQSVGSSFEETTFQELGENDHEMPGLLLGD
jgi:hypothetical protein